MKKIITLANILFVAGCSYAQTVNASTTENYIYTKTCLDENCIKKAEQVQYFDGLGRPKQLVDIKATPSGKDVVSHIQYDEFGRTTKEYLPVPQAGTQNGAIYTDPLNNASTIFGNEKIFSLKELEDSPFSRVKKVTPLGNDWAAHPTNVMYGANVEGEVKKYTVSTSWQDNATWSTLSENGTYGSNQLTKNTVTDADGNSTTEFKTTDGQTILVRKNDGTQNVDTYYVYNEYGQQVIVIPPLASTTTLDKATLDILCYQYRYDGLGRLVEKKNPGKGWEYMVYDKVDRQILSQDTVMKSQGKWLMSKYDKFGRVLYTGIITGDERVSLQNSINSTIISESSNTTGFVKSGITVYYSNDYFTSNLQSVVSVNYYGTYPQGTPSRPMLILGQNTIGDNMNVSLNTKNLLTASYVKNIEDDSWTKNYIWYDEQSRAVGTYSINHLGGSTKTESQLDFAGVTKQSKVYHKRLDPDIEKVITQTFEYDNQNRLLSHTHQVDHQPVEILAQNEYNELSQVKNKKVGGTSPSSPLQSMDYTYNIRGNVVKINDPANLNGKLFGYEIKYTNPEYNTIGTRKYNGSISEVDWKNASENVLKRYTYAYDGLNRLKDAIYSEPYATTPFNNNFNENVSYDLNGNIKTLKRNAFPVFGTTSTLVDDLVYQYTGNRLDKVIENALNDTGYEGGNNIIDYDLNGNMINMKDKGIQNIGYNYLNLADSYSITQNNPLGNSVSFGLTYLYRADGTKLRKTYSTGGGRGQSTNYKYTDYLDGFQYNFNETIVPCLWCRTNVAYEAQAFKDQITVDRPPITPVWQLDFVPTSEGVYSFTENRYIYQYKDHLGNARVSFAKNTAGVLEITDTNNYYVFGMNHIGGIKSSLGGYQNYKYNGKELQETGFYDYGARFYMPDLGRWGVVDPLAEATRRFSPYNYAMNNPVMFIDPDGRKAISSQYEGYENHLVEGSYMWQMLGGSFNPHQKVNTGGGGSSADFGGFGYTGSGTTFGETQAFRDIMSGKTSSIINQNGYLSYWTDGAADQNSIVNGEMQVNAQEVVFHKMKVGDTSWDSVKSWADYGSGTIGTMYQAIADQRTALYNRGYWVDNLGNQRSVAYAGRALDSQIGLRSSYVRTTAMYGKYAKRAGYVGLALGAYEVGEGFSQDGWNLGKNTTVAAAKVGTGIAVGYAVGAAAPWLTGAIAGAAGGSLAPGVGTVIGFIVGGLAAYYSSEYVGEAVENSYK